MAFEVTCGHCAGRLLIETPGVTVACPHCGAHITAEDPDAAPPAIAGEPGPAELSASAANSANGGGAPPAADAAMSLEYPDVSSLQAHEPAAGFPSFHDPAVDISAGGDAAVAFPSLAAPSDGNAAPTSPKPAGGAAAHDTNGGQTASVSAARRRPATVPLSWFIMVAGMASALLIACILLLMEQQSPKTHQLESLPDVVPPVSPTGKIERRLYDHMVDIPPGHTLVLKEKPAIRFGNLLVEPLKVTREPLVLRHYSGRGDERRPPVLKLWLRLENVSTDRAFVPLDAELLWGQAQYVEGRRRSNTFVARAADKGKVDRYVLPLLHSPDLDYQPTDLPLGRALKPGEGMTLCIPTEDEGIDRLEGPLVWRVHLRKGHNPKSGRGVTTLVEVAFDSSEIQ